MSSIKEKVVSGFLWRFLQHSSSQIIGFIITIFLARILEPSDYGLVAMMNVFTTIAMVFINTGFTSAIIQKKDLTELDKDSMFYGGVTVSLILYAILFIGAPLIANFYHEQILIKMIRVQSLMLIFGALYSVHQALIIRELHFRKSFVISLTGVIAQGCIGITTAMLGFGAWALVFGTVSNSFVCMTVAWIVVKWKPHIRFSFSSIKSMLSFSIKVLLGGLLDAIFNNIRSLIIGSQYSSEDLAYYNRGFQFPSLLMTQIDGSMTTVLFSSLSKYQENWDEGLRMLRRAMKLSIYICAPLMAGMVVVAKPMILLLLTEKWADCIIYVQLGAIICIFWPLSARLHALNARGKSGVALVIKIIGKAITIFAIILTYRHSVFELVIGSILASFLSLCVNSIIYEKYLDYKLIDQIKDIAPSIILSAVMGGIVYWIQYLPLHNFVILVLQIATGVGIYVGLSYLFRIDSFSYLLEFVRQLKNKKGLSPKEKI